MQVLEINVLLNTVDIFVCINNTLFTLKILSILLWRYKDFFAEYNQCYSIAMKLQSDLKWIEHF